GRGRARRRRRRDRVGERSGRRTGARRRARDVASVGEVADELRRAIGGDRDLSREVNTLVGVDQRDLVLAGGELDRALRSHQAGVLAVDQDRAGRLGGDCELAGGGGGGGGGRRVRAVRRGGDDGGLRSGE